MTALELEAIATATAQAIKASVDRAVSSLLSDVRTLASDVAALKSDIEQKSAVLDVRHRFDPLQTQIKALQDVPPIDIDAIAKRAAELIPIPKNGKDADPVDVELVASKAAALIPIPKDGTSVSLSEVEPLIARAIDLAVAALPKPKDVIDAITPDLNVIAKMAADLVPSPKDGVSINPDDVHKMVAAALEACKKPKDGVDGNSVSVEDVAPLVQAEVSKAVSSLPKPKDGVGIVSALIDRQGELVLTLTDGSTKELGRVAGKDVELSDVQRMVSDELAKWPKPANGVDGFSLEDFKLEHDGERKFTFIFERGELKKSFSFSAPTMIYRGVFEEGRVYDKGDTVTWGGHAWVAKVDTRSMPSVTDSGSRDWIMAVKKGRDGREGKPGPQVPPGVKGNKGDPVRFTS